jgi:hypothetical protein
VPARDLDDERDDDRADDDRAGQGGGVDVHLTEALVAPVAAQPADRLAPAAEEDQRAESRQYRQRL